MNMLENVTEEDIELALEDYMFPVLYSKMINDINCKEKDDFVLVIFFLFFWVE